MQRMALVVPLLLLAACAGQDTVGPSDNESAQAMKIPGPSMTAVLDENSTFSFATGSACTIGINDLACAFTVIDVPAGTYTLSLVGRWQFTYQCVNSRTGKTNKHYPPASGTAFTRGLYYPNQSVSGNYSGGSLTLTLAGVQPDNACAGNKGPFTQMNVLSQNGDYWTMILGTSTGTYEYAAIYEFL